MFDVETGRLQSRYVTEFHSKVRTSRGRSELRSLGFGPISDNEDLVRIRYYSAEFYDMSEVN